MNGAGALQSAGSEYPYRTYTYTAPDGTVANFGVPQTSPGQYNPVMGEFVSTSPAAEQQVVLLSVTKPDGETLTYTYTAYSVPVGYGLPGATTYAHLQAVTSNRGYQIHLTYDPNNMGMMTKAVAINTALDSGCAVTTNDCGALPHAWPTLTMSLSATSYSGWTESVTDSNNHTTVYTQNSAGTLTIQRPGGGTLTWTYTDGIYNAAGFNQTATLNDGAGTWQYSQQIAKNPYWYDQVLEPESTTVTDPAGNTRTVQLYWVDPALAYDPVLGRVTTVTRPEGDAENYTYDSRGNITAVQRASSGASLTTTVTASYPTPCTNFFSCNKPTWTKDGNGNETDYTYDAYGNLLTTTAPAGANGIRPTTTNTYSQVSVAGGSVWRLTQSSTCRTLASCANTANEMRTTIAYTGSTDGQPITFTKAGGDGSASSSSIVAYNYTGGIDHTVNALGQTTSFSYDVMRQKTGEVDPAVNSDGNNIGTSTVYTADGLVSTVQTGVAPGGNLGALQVQQSAAYSYDAEDRKIQAQTLDGSGNVLTLTQYSYDAFSRLVCTAVRMTPSTFGQQSNACALGPQGTDADRISTNNYDFASRLTSVTQANGTGAARTYQTVTYGADGETLTVADANNNLTTYGYDGILRQISINYPLAGGGGSDPNNYESFTYDVPSLA